MLRRNGFDDLLITDISVAQRWLGKVGQLDRIDLIIPTDARGAVVRTQLDTILPRVCA
jgi:hypothetical protein